MSHFNFDRTERQNQKTIFDQTRICVGKIKDTRNLSKNGAIKVWLVTSTTDENNSDNWIVVYKAPLWYGHTPIPQSSNDFSDSVVSYGENFTVPDVDNYVFIFFPNLPDGITQGYYFAFMPQTNINHMIPGLHYEEVDGEIHMVTEYNNHQGMDKKEIYKPLDEAIKKQGLDTDMLRGLSSSSMKRETPSRAYGFLTPRGTQIVFDDGFSEKEAGDNWNTKKNKINRLSDNPALNDEKRQSELIRFRTRSGTQLLLSETEGHIYLINRDGTAWMELNNAGYIDMWAEKGINLRTNGDLNLRADNNINIESGKDINIRAAGGSLNVNSETDMNFYSETSIAFKSMGTYSIQVSANYELLAPAVNLTAIVNAQTIKTASMTIVPSVTSAQVKNFDTIKTTSQKDANNKTLQTIVNRLPYKEPCYIHDTDLQTNYMSTSNNSSVVV